MYTTGGTVPFQRLAIFPRAPISRLAIPIVQPPAGILRPQPSRGHSEIKGLWR